MAAIALCGLAVVSCGKGGGKQVSLTNASTADSVGFLAGGLTAADVIAAQQTDTLLKSEKNMKAYAEGFNAGLKAYKEGDEAYNRGFVDAMRAITSLNIEAKDYDLKITPDAVASGFASLFDKDGKPLKDAAKKGEQYETDFANLTTGLEAKRQAKASQATAAAVKKAAANLPKEAKTLGFSNRNGVYVKEVNPGTGAALKKTDSVLATTSIRDNKGKVFGQEGTVTMNISEASSYSPALAKVVETFKEGGTYELLGTLSDLFVPEAVNQFVQKGADPNALYTVSFKFLELNPQNYANSPRP